MSFQSTTAHTIIKVNKIALHDSWPYFGKKKNVLKKPEKILTRNYVASVPKGELDLFKQNTWKIRDHIITLN